MNNSILLLREVSLELNGQKILDLINFNLEKGKILTIFGDRNVGKTMLLQLVSGLQKNFQGDIFIKNKDIKLYKRHPNLFFLPENFSPPQYLTGLEFIRSWLFYYRKSYTSYQIFNEAEQLNMDSQLLSKTLSTCSKDLVQMINILLAKLCDAEIIVLDEPTSLIKGSYYASFYKFLFNLKSHGRTVLMSTRFWQDIPIISDQVMTLKKGRLTPTFSSRNLLMEQTL